MLDAPEGGADPVGEIEQDAEADAGQGHDQDRAVGPEIALQEIAEPDPGHRGDDDLERQPRAVVHLAQEQAKQAGGHAGDIAPEIEQDGDQRPDMGAEIDHQPLVGPAGQGRHEDELTRGADRPELPSPWTIAIRMIGNSGTDASPHTRFRL